MCLFNFFKFKMSLYESGGLGTRKIGEINSISSYLGSFISLLKNISCLAENFIENFLPYCRKVFITKFYRHNRDRQNIFIACQFLSSGKVPRLEPGVKLFILWANCNFTSSLLACFAYVNV